VRLAVPGKRQHPPRERSGVLGTLLCSGRYGTALKTQSSVAEDKILRPMLCERVTATPFHRQASHWPPADLAGRLLTTTERKKQTHKAQQDRARAAITALGSRSLWRAQPVRTNYLRLLSSVLLQPVTTLLAHWEGQTQMKRGRK